MSPFEIKILLHSYGSRSPAPELEIATPRLVAETMAWFCTNELMRLEADGYVITERGRVWCEHVMRLDLPVWAMP